MSKLNTNRGDDDISGYQYFETLTDMFQVLELLYDHNGKAVDYIYLRVNPAFENLVGMNSDQLLGKRVKDLFDVVEDHWFETYQKVVETGTSTVYENYGKELDKYYQVYVWKAAENQVGVTFRDITEKTVMQKALVQSEEQLQSLFDHVREGAALCEMIYDHSSMPIDYRFLKVNASFKKQIGLDCPSVIQKSAKELYPDVEDSLIARYGKVVTSGHSDHFVDYNKNTKRFYDVVAFSPLENQFVMLFNDITRLTKSEKELEKFQRLDSIGKLAGGVAHDFNNMLSVILGYAEMALAENKNDNALGEYLEAIQDAAKKSAKTTQQLLAYASKQTITPVVVNLNLTIEDTVGMWRKLIGENIDFTFSPNLNLWSVKVDVSQIDQILANLYTNAKAAIDEVGSIIVETDNVRISHKDCDLNSNFLAGNYVRISVSDDGHGMSKETLESIFEPFFTTKSTGEGTGLGLASVYGSVRQNNGFIDVKSTLNVGTTLSVYLPQSTAEQFDSKEQYSDNILKDGTELILLVEDEPAVLKMTSMLLSSLGYTVLAASTPEKAMVFIQEHGQNIHLLLTDVVMPQMNGRELARRIFKLQPQIKCLFMSGYEADVVDYEDLEFDECGFINKPFSKKTLSTSVSTLLKAS